MSTTAPLDPALWQTVSPHRCHLGESPFWHPQEQMLYWVDIPGRQVLRANIYMGSVETWDMPAEPGCIAPANGGGLVLALRDGIFCAASWGAPLQLIATLNINPATTRANDGKCDTQGRFWVGTMDETRQLKNAGLYCVDARTPGAPRADCKIPPTSGVTTANALAFSADDRTLYWGDSASHAVWAWDFDAASGTMTNQRSFISASPKPAGWQPLDAGYGGRADGAAVDAQGNYWVAMYEGQRVCQFAPDGTLLASLPTPLLCPTMVCLGGEDLKTLFVTSAGLHRSAAEQAAYPLSGCVLSTRVAVAGLPVNTFQGCES
ncbi:SMP-30/gluconolactonase/LRE family protein [Rhodoferax sp. 4810]|nr:SMP-30/gluconolactonase/LRE family protein [Rhodoferax jenense]